MLVKNLSVLNFRNFERTDISFNDRLNLIIGDNGQGKTNILEALYLLSEGESFRYSKNENLIKLQNSTAIINADIIHNNLDFKLSLRINNKKKNFL